jgi:peroxiredoxin
MNQTAETAAPDLTLADHEGNAVRLSSLWQAKPLVLFFVRHFG